MTEKLSQNLKRLRSQRGITQKELASRLHLSNSTISNYENDIHEPGCDTLAFLAEFYGVSIDYLIGRQSTGLPQQRVIYGKYTLDRFLHLLDTLPEKRLSFLVDFLVLLEGTGDS